MGRIINVLGPHGVGKTTLWNYIRNNNLGIAFDGFDLPTKGYDLKDKNSYFEYENLYIQRVNEENNYIKKSNQDGFVIRSIEEIIYFLKSSNLGYSDEFLQDILKNNTNCDFLIYLDASTKVLENRYLHDDLRDIPDTIIWYEKLYSRYSSYFKNMPNIIIINTDNLTTEEVYNKIMESIKGL